MVSDTVLITLGNITSCKMHDLMHDLAISVAGDNVSGSHSKITCIDGRTLHFSFEIGGDSEVHDFSSLLKAKKLRTFLPLLTGKFPIKEKEIQEIICNLRCLRVLDLFYMGISSLPSSIDKLIHLRYLDIRENNDIRKLPDSISNLLNLQVLRLHSCRRLSELPNNIQKLVNLEHLDNDYCKELTHMPQGIGQLTRLEKLSNFVIAKDNCVSKNVGGLAELHGLNNLRGKLSISNLRYLKNPKSEFQAANLSLKKQLTELTLQWNEHDNDGGDCSAEDVASDETGLEALQPNQSLKIFSVLFYRGVKPPSWLTSLTQLVWISFESCKNIRWLPSFGHLPCLKRFWIFSLTNLEFIDIAVENGGSVSFFPSLTHFAVTGCPNLKGFMRCTGDSGITPLPDLPCFPCVSFLIIGNCSNLNHMPLFPELKILYLERDGVKTLKEILKNAESTSSPFTALSELEKLANFDMEEFPEDEMLQYLSCLQCLEFLNCNFKTMASDEIDGGAQWQSLQALTYVSFVDMKNLVSIPKGLQYVSNLQSLHIQNCSSLVCMPEWMPNLTALQHLTVIKCPQLSERCKNDKAEDWHKISHIPNISINRRSIQRNGCYML